MTRARVVRRRATTRRGTPAVAILCSAVVGLVCVLLNYLAPDEVFTFLVNSTGAIAIFVWIVIAVAQLRSRRFDQVSASESSDRVGGIRMWGHPWLTVMVVVALVALLVSMFFGGPARLLEVTTSCAIAAAAVVAGVVVQRKRRVRP